MATQVATAPKPSVRARPGSKIISVITTTDHKVIGNMYLITSFAFFLLAGVMALLIRAELMYPGMQLMNNETYNQLFTMHGTIPAVRRASAGSPTCRSRMRCGPPASAATCGSSAWR